MKLKPEVNIVEFIQTVQMCNGDVCFTTQEGDRLNLSSKLSQCLFSIIASKSDLMDIGNIELNDPNDMDILHDYLTCG